MKSFLQLTSQPRASDKGEHEKLTSIHENLSDNFVQLLENSQ